MCLVLGEALGIQGQERYKQKLQFKKDAHPNASLCQVMPPLVVLWHIRTWDMFIDHLLLLTLGRAGSL